MRIDKEMLTNFKHALEQWSYAELVNVEMQLKGVTWDSFLRKEKDTFTSAITNNLMYKLFLLGEPVSLAQFLQEVEEPGWLDYLQEIGIVIKTGSYIRTNNYMLIPINGKLIFADIPFNFGNCKNRNTEVYFGLDSLLLLLYKPRNKAECALDLCTGSGIQIITNSDYYERSTGVDINPVAIQMAELNVALNDLERKVKILSSNLYEALHEKYDLIFANPPFLPMAKDIKFSLIGDGGEDGFQIVNEIIDGFPQYLNPDGEVIMIGECLGSDTSSMIEDVVKKKLKKGYSTDIHLFSRMPSEVAAYALASVKSRQKENFQTYNIISERLYDLYKQYGDYYYSYIIRLRKVKDDYIDVPKVKRVFVDIALHNRFTFVDIHKINKKTNTLHFRNKCIKLSDFCIVALLKISKGFTVEESVNASALQKQDQHQTCSELISILDILLKYNIVIKKN